MTIAEDLAMTFELCGSGTLSEAAARIFVVELAPYPADAVHLALARCRREVTGRLSLAHVIERIDDGRPGAEEAWALLPKNEADSGAITAEIAEAMRYAIPLIASGDLIQARMAFVEVYRRRVSEARARREPTQWRVTLGHDPTGREAAARDLAARLRIEAPPDQAMIEAPLSVDAVPEELRKITKWLAGMKSVEQAIERDEALEAAAEAHAAGRRCETGCDRCWAEGR